MFLILPKNVLNSYQNIIPKATILPNLPYYELCILVQIINSIDYTICMSSIDSTMETHTTNLNEIEKRSCEK